jgi:SAM-dependent methyltransferase
VVGLDPSVRSIRHARFFFAGLDFQCTTLEEEARRSSDRYDGIVANMVVHSVAGLAGFLRAARRLLDGPGTLLATLPNPRLYLRTREGVDLRDFDYDRESAHRLPFRIRGGEPHPEPVWHYHRPVEVYEKYLAEAGFGGCELFEPDPVGERDWRDVLVIRARG